MKPQKPNSSIGSSVTLGLAAWMLLRTLIAFGPTKMRVCRRSAGVAQRRAEDRQI